MTENAVTQNKFIILVPFRNAGHYIIDCVNAILNQEYNNYEVYFLDDASDDDTLSYIEDDINGVHKIRREKPLGAMENIYRALTELPINEEDIVLIVDGDDYLFGEFVLQIINEKYTNGTLITGGGLINNYGILYKPFAYTREEFENLRTATWRNPHPKSFRYALFKAFMAQDPEGKNFKHADGDFFTYTSDMALMFPLMEIAGYENVCFIPNVLYCYRQHANNVHFNRDKKLLQEATENEIRSRYPLRRMFDTEKSAIR